MSTGNSGDPGGPTILINATSFVTSYNKALQENADLKGEMAVLKAEMAVLDAERAVFFSDIKRFVTENKELKEGISALTEQNHSLVSRCKALEQENVDLYRHMNAAGVNPADRFLLPDSK